MAAGVVRQLLLGLGIHDLPAIRELAPEFERISFARAVPPIGYAVGFRSSRVQVQLAAVMLPDGPDAQWRLSIGTTRGVVDIDYPPAFVHAGSAVVRVRTAEGRLIEHPADPDDGYVREWRALDAELRGDRAIDYDGVLADALFAIAIADGAADVVRGVPA
ncbi:hypothetical protein [Naasia aerilata]|uniref:Gfo/Idh/MocA-like oxidoreductase C-terminal domain-containing protein n=1 Tax=Naasia aerilata TaxID=1162966 RepID=A0ABN6XK04_9MICO|nr:hypothetical protein [Naasia aerilata]BDZ44448.1 hypothetical protein GCM10025866_03570 [Naasia aerilata]